MVNRNGWHDARVLVHDAVNNYNDVWLEFQWQWNINLSGETLQESVEKTQAYLDRLWAVEDAGETLNEPILLWVSPPEIQGRSIRNSVMLDALDPDRNRVFEPRVLIRNGREVIECDAIVIDGNRVRVSFDHYGSYIEGVFDPHNPGDVFTEGRWVKDRGEKGIAELPLVSRMPIMVAGFCPTNGWPATQEVIEQLSGKWAVQFASSGDAVGQFETVSYANEQEFSRIHATFRTPTGDYRFIAGWIEPEHVETQRPKIHMSAFDGAHAFHFTADLLEDGSLKGDFWSGNWHHETWTAVRDDNATLPDAFEQTMITDEQALADAVFKNIDGNPTRVLDALDETNAKARVLEIFGTWCPNCSDAGRELVSLKEKYGDDLGIVALAFEVTEDFERSSQQVQRHHAHIGSDWEILIAGLSDKAKATETLGFLDKVRSYPTLIFLNERNEVQAVYSGFSGPATGDAYTNQRERFEALIERMINE